MIRAAGALLWRENSELKVEIALIHRPRYDDWSLPKGKVEEGETSLRCAFREVIEETGITPQFGRELGSVQYEEAAGVKQVKYWAAKATNSQTKFEVNEEVDEIKWLLPDEALEIATHQSDKEIIESFLTTEPRTDILIILRHTKALERGDWDGEDSMRILDERGFLQAEALVEHLQPFALDEIYSSNYIRCVQTILPLSQARELKITEIPNLNEEIFELDPERSISFANAVKQDEKNILICSHNPVIPTMLRGILNTKLKNKDLIKLEPGDAWIVHRVRGEIVALDFLAIP